MNSAELRRQLAELWPGLVRASLHENPDGRGMTCVVEPPPELLPEVCGQLFLDLEFSFAGLVVEEGTNEWHLRYMFYGEHEAGWVHVVMNVPLSQRVFPSIVKYVHAADWHEREAEDLFGLQFEGHPRLGDFVLHDDTWQEGVEPMRRSFDAQTPVVDRRPNTEWRPSRILEAPGAFAMPIGPVFSGVTESVHFLLETVGEDVTRALPRLFYKYRGIEKIAEGRSFDDVLLLAERFAATTAFAHALAYCQAVESICQSDIPPRAKLLRLFIAELERLRHHVGAIEGICESTGLVVAASEVAMLEEQLLRVSGALTGHRYMFGLAMPGGLVIDLDDVSCHNALRQCHVVTEKLEHIERVLRVSSSFLDRLEEAGLIAQTDAMVFGLVGPIARASGIRRDMREMQPYGAYRRFPFAVPVEEEGDGYARLRILFKESWQSLRLMDQALAALSDGPVSVPLQVHGGAAMGWVEAPRGAAFHWLRMSADGIVERYHIVSPSFINWLGFHLSVERFTFQDFPIILSTLDLSVSENDR